MCCFTSDPLLRDYWVYEGSLTTPPCSEKVTWILYRYPLTISQMQVNITLYTFNTVFTFDTFLIYLINSLYDSYDVPKIVWVWAWGFSSVSVITQSLTAMKCSLPQLCVSVLMSIVSQIQSLVKKNLILPPSGSHIVYEQVWGTCLQLQLKCEKLRHVWASKV